jgi:integrase
MSKKRKAKAPKVEPPPYKLVAFEAPVAGGEPEPVEWWTQEQAEAGQREFGTLRLRGRIWWLRYRVGGREHEESSHSTRRREAQKLLDKRQAELSVGILTAPDTKRVTFSDLADMVRSDYQVRGRRSLDRLEISIAHLADYFGACRALSITTDRITGYERERLESGASRSTVNAELAALRRAFNLAVKARRLPLSAKPFISTPDPHNARSGFFEDSDFRAVLAELPQPLRPAMEFAYWTGWRIQDEVLALTWAQMDFDAGVVRLEENTTKSGKGRTFPFSALPDLAALLEWQRAHTDAVERLLGLIVPTVFHRNGKPILAYLDAWRSACKRASTVKRGGLESVVRPRLVGRTPHDFRRTAARNLIRAGVSQHVVMQLCGWKTDAMFRRYAIVDERDLRDAVAKLAELGPPLEASLRVQSA